MARSCQPGTDDQQQPEGEGLGWDVPGHAKLPGALLVAVMAVAWIAHIHSGGMAGWGVSGAAIAGGRFRTIFLHMFAHGGAVHIAMNGFALFALSGPLVARMGTPPLGWLRYLALFLMSGLAGMTCYVAIHPSGTVPMLGASGAIYGLLGALIRLPPEGEMLMPIRSERTKAIIIDLVKSNALLFALFAIPPLLLGQSGGLAWEAHLGGFLFGLMVGPWFVPGTTATRGCPD